MAEIQALCLAHEVKKEILLIARGGGDPKEIEQIQGCKKALLPFQGNLALVEALLATTTGAPPEFNGTQPVKVVGVDKSLKKEQLVSLRIMVVKEILEKSELEWMKEDPTYAIHLLDCKHLKAEIKTSGWTEQSEAYVGYIEIEKEKVDDILKLSGKAGVFVSALRKNVIEWPNVAWKIPTKDETMKQYHQRVFHNAQELEKPLAFRRGGGAALGIVMPETEEDSRSHSWFLTGAPWSWGPVTLSEWLERQGWSVLDCKQPMKKSRPWTFRGRKAGEVSRRSFSYEVQQDEDSFYIHVKRWEKRRKADEDVVPISGARWWSKDTEFDPIEDTEMESKDKDKEEITQTWPDTAAPTAMDDASAGNVNAGDEDQEDKEKSGSPPKKKSKHETKKPDLDKVSDGSAGPPVGARKTTIVDTGGKGDCGWRALAYAISYINKPDLPETQLMDKLSALSKTLHTKISLHLVGCRKEWEQSWAPDPKTSEAMEAGTIPQSVDDYCRAIRRPLRWVDGLQLASAAVQQRINIVCGAKRMASGPASQSSNQVNLGERPR